MPKVVRVRRLLALLCLVLGAVGSGGCFVASLQPFYDPASLEQDDAFIGEWESQEDKTTCVVERGEWKAYVVTVEVPAGRAVLTAHLTRIGGARYVDVTPALGLERGELMLPVHAVARLAIEGDKLRVEPLDYDALTSDEGRKALGKLAHALDSRGNLVLTSPTAALRDWLASDERRPVPFRDPIVLTRKKR